MLLSKDYYLSDGHLFCVGRMHSHWRTLLGNVLRVHVVDYERVPEAGGRNMVLVTVDDESATAVLLARRWKR